jgi:ParB family chromosome partitioning protein
MHVKPALGRGLGSLIPGVKPSYTEQALPHLRQEILQVNVKSIHPNPRQPRHHFSPGELEDLIASIKEHGILQPLIVTKDGEGYELVAGERRLRAARTLGLEQVPAIVREATEQQKLELALIENIQRQDLNAVEEAYAYRALIDEFQLTQEEVAKRVGKNRSTVANILRLLDLPEEILQAVRDGRITKSHARTLLAEEDPQARDHVFRLMLTGPMTVREVEERTKPQEKKNAGRFLKDPNILAHEERLRELLGTKVEIFEKRGHGKVAIHFYSREELFELLDKLSDL